MKLSNYKATTHITHVFRKSSKAHAVVRYRCFMHTCSLSPCGPVSEGRFLFSRGIWGVLRPNYAPKISDQISGEKKPFVNGLTGAHRTPVQSFSMYFPRKRRELPTLHKAWVVHLEPAITMSCFHSVVPHQVPMVYV